MRPRHGTTAMLVATLVAVTPTMVHAAPASMPAGLRMRTEPATTEPAQGREYTGPTAVRDEPERGAPWVPAEADRSPSDDPASSESAAPSAESGPDAAAEGPAPDPVMSGVPSPSSVRDVPEHIAVAVGLAPEAPGSRDEKARLDQLEATVAASLDPTTETRRLRPGAGTPRQICREHRDDLVVMLGYVADRPEPVVLAHDCRLDQALQVRGADAIAEPELVAVLWREHLELQRSGLRERRRVSLGRRGRGIIIGGVATVVVGVAVGLLVANALRQESVVITVRP